MLRDIAPRPFALGAALLLIAGAVLALEQPWAPQSRAPPAPADLPAALAQYPAAPDFGGATGWLGSPPLDLEALRGQVVLVDFWTYSCINCIRTFPHVQGWFSTYNASGFVVVGVHTPEFAFERDAGNVQGARERYGLTYPTAQDNDYRIWNAYKNRYWPAEYLIDAYGRVRHTHFGEGAYAETEDTIRALLAEAGRSVPQARFEGIEGGAAWSQRLTPELYAAEGSRSALGNPEGYHPGQVVTYARPTEVPRDRIFVAGTWVNHDEELVAQGNATVLVRFFAGGANFVASGPSACVPVLLDGAPIAREVAGRDVAFDRGAPCIPLDAPRSYDFYAGPQGEHLLELQVPDGFALFTFAFSPDGRR